MTIRVAEIITSTLGGAGEHLYNVIRYSQHLGISYTVLGAMEGSVPEKLQGLGVQLIDEPIPKTIAPTADIKSLARIVGYLRRLQPDAVHTHCAKAGLLGRLAARLYLNVPVVHTPHGFPFVKTSAGVKQRLYTGLERLGARWCDRIVAVSEKERLDGIRYVAPSEKIQIIYNGVSAEDYQSQTNLLGLREEYGIPLGAFVIGSVGRLTEQKAPHVLVKTVQLLSLRGQQAFLIFVGAGELEQSLRQLAEDLQVSDRVIFAGWRTDLPQVYSSFDVLALSSAWEAFGLVLVEAMLCNVPVVASRVDGIPEVVEHGVSGLLADPGNPQAFADAISVLIADRPFRNQLVINARARALERFTAHRMAAETAQLYFDLIGVHSC